MGTIYRRTIRFIVGGSAAAAGASSRACTGAAALSFRTLHPHAVAQVVEPDQQIDESRRGLDPAEIEDATRKWEQVENRWREAVGMPPVGPR